MRIQDIQVGSHVSFIDHQKVKRHGVVETGVDGQGNVVVGQLSPPIADDQTVTKNARDLTAEANPDTAAYPAATQVGARVSFVDAAGTHVGVIESHDDRGYAVIGNLNPAIAGNATVTKAPGELSAA